MKTLNIKTYNMNATTNNLQFYILSKGYNAGKPLDKPCPNCFVVTAETIEQRYQLFWICYSLWKSGTFLRLLCGSVIPFLHIRDASAEVERAMDWANVNRTQFDELVQKLQRLIETEKLLKVQLSLIDRLKMAMAEQLIRSGK